MSTELEKLTRKYMSLVNVSTTLNTELDLVQLLPVIMLNAKDLLEAEASSLFLTDEKNEFLFCEVAIGEKDEIVRTFSQIPMGAGIAGWVAKHAKPVLLEDAYLDERFSKEWDLKTGFRTLALICVPLYVQDRVVGDFYSYFPLSEDRVGVLAIDVTGHGLSAALLAVMVNTLITTFEPSVMNSPGEFMVQLNEALINRLGGNFATAVYVIVDMKAELLTYASAGHPYPFLARNAEQDVLALKSAGKLLGVVSGVLFEERQIPFRERDRLVLFTDGLLEITDGVKQFMYSDDELRDFVRREAHLSPGELCKAIVAEAQHVTGSNKFDDDVTLLVIGR